MITTEAANSILIYAYHQAASYGATGHEIWDVCVKKILYKHYLLILNCFLILIRITEYVFCPFTKTVYLLSYPK